jgi:hypothetical protein
MHHMLHSAIAIHTQSPFGVVQLLHIAPNSMQAAGGLGSSAHAADQQTYMTFEAAVAVQCACKTLKTPLAAA